MLDINIFLFSMKIMTEFEGEGEMAKLTYLNPCGNIFCLSYISEKKTLDDKITAHGKYCVKIFNSLTFLERIFEELTKIDKDIEIYIGAVEYLNRTNYDGDWNPYMKANKYDWENEFRIFIKSNKFVNKTIKISIGNISDIARLIKKI
jgi:hypothetical protein